MWKLILIGVGGVMAFTGWQEFKLRDVSKAEPVVMTLAELVKAESIDNAHVKLSDYVEVYQGLVYSGSTRVEGDIDVSYFPIISTEHPFVTAFADLAAKFPDGVPETEPFPELEDFRVIVKTKRFTNTSQVSGGFDAGDSIQGLVLNKIEKLGGEEMKLLNESYPKVSAERLLLLEEGRAPASVGSAAVQMGGGGVLALAGVFLLMRGGKRRREQG